MYITLATYSFSGYGLGIDSFEVLRETPKCYFCAPRIGRREYRFLKDELNKTIYQNSDYCPYLKVIMINGTEEQVKEKLAEWFRKKADEIINK